MKAIYFRMKSVAIRAELAFKMSAFALLLCASSIVSAQNSYSDVADENTISKNDAAHPCISEQEYQQLEERIAKNQTLLGLTAKQNGNNSVMTTALSWPLQPSVKLHDCSYYVISAYVDQNTTAGAFQDYNCGTNTYDSHKGTDISSWPYNFYKMDSSLVEVIAAAPGTIIDWHDGEFDRNCAATTVSANYIAIQHADGSTALYFHMKKNSVTSKAVGQTVAAGEYLGVVGSSGNASGPHLHFEIWSGSTVATRVDPYSGTCNTLNGSSWWTAQKPYKETAVVKVSVNSTDAVVPGCPSSEIPNESNYFTIPFTGAGLSPGYAKFYLFIREELSGLVGNLSIIRPDGSTYLTWNYTSTTNSKTKIFGYSKMLPTVSGTYTFTATYNGTTCSTPFTINNPLGINSNIVDNSSISVYPNPSARRFTIESLEADHTILGTQFTVYNTLGEKVFESTLSSSKTNIELNVESGMYYYKLRNEKGDSSSGKLVVE